MPFLPHGPWVTPYTNLNVHGNILSLHIFVLVSMLLPINSHPFFTFFAWKREFFFFLILAQFGDPHERPLSPLLQVYGNTDYFDYFDIYIFLGNAMAIFAFFPDF